MRAIPSEHLIMCPDGEQQDGLGALVLHELEDDPEVVTGAARPTALQIALELMGLELRVKGIFGEQFQSDPQALVDVRSLLEQPFRRSRERR
jgi:hypothetical protein